MRVDLRVHPSGLHAPPPAARSTPAAAAASPGTSCPTLR